MFLCTTSVPVRLKHLIYFKNKNKVIVSKFSAKVFVALKNRKNADFWTSSRHYTRAPRLKWKTTYVPFGRKMIFSQLPLKADPYDTVSVPETLKRKPSPPFNLFRTTLLYRCCVCVQILLTGWFLNCCAHIFTVAFSSGSQVGTLKDNCPISCLLQW